MRLSTGVELEDAVEATASILGMAAMLEVTLSAEITSFTGAVVCEIACVGLPLFDTPLSCWVGRTVVENGRG